MFCKPVPVVSQFFGTLRVGARSRDLHVALHDLSGRAIYELDLEAER